MESRFALCLAALTVSALGCGKDSAPTVASPPPVAALPQEFVAELRPEEQVLSAQEAIVFSVTFRNVSKQTYSLFDLEFEVPSALHFTHLASGVTWDVHSQVRYWRSGQVSATLPPGKSYEARIVLDHKWGFQTGEGSSFRRVEHLPPGKYSVSMDLKLHDPKLHPIEGIQAKTFFVGSIRAGPATFGIAGNIVEPGKP